ncbi:MAG: hypothetical protein RLN76_01110 [Phycisphaeraceae bacterium]
MEKTWTKLRDEIAALAQTGREIMGAVSDLGGGEPVTFYPAGSQDAVKTWLGEAHRLAARGGQASLVADLHDAVRAWTGRMQEKGLYEAGEGLRLEDFGERITLEGEEYVDPLDARYRFDRLVRELLRIAEFGASLRPVGPDTSAEYWTREELANYRQVKPETISKEISAVRKKTGKDPIWVRREPGKERGFKVHVATYTSEMRAGMARG